MSIRIGRINAEMQKSITGTIAGGKVKDPRVEGMVSVTKVDCAADLKTAKVFVTSLGGDIMRTVEGLNSSSGLIKRQLASDLKSIRTVPDLTFFADMTAETGGRIDAILDELKGE